MVLAIFGASQPMHTFDNRRGKSQALEKINNSIKSQNILSVRTEKVVHITYSITLYIMAFAVFLGAKCGDAIVQFAKSV